MKDLHKQWLTWAILTAVVLAISLFFGVNYPMPEQPAEPPGPVLSEAEGPVLSEAEGPIVELGGNFSNPVDIEGTSSAAAPALTFEDDTDSGFFRSAADTLNIATGGTERLEIDSSALTIVPTLELNGALAAASTATFSDTVTFAAGILFNAADATAAFTATASDCGTTYFLNAATEFQTILPAMSEVSAGCTFQFIVKAAPASASYTVITGNDDEDTLIVGINELEVDTGDDGPYDASADTITFVDGVSVVGDYVYLITDGTMWYGRGQANADGGITVTDSD